MGSPAIVPTLTEMYFFINCIPDQIKPDPVYGTFHVKYDNTLGTAPGSAKIISSQLEITEYKKPVFTWDFHLESSKSGNVPAGSSAEVLHKKLAGSGSGVDSPCGHCGGHWSLKVQWNVEGKIVDQATDSEDVECKVF